MLDNLQYPIGQRMRDTYADDTLPVHMHKGRVQEYVTH